MSTLCFLAATKQLYEWFSPSVRPSVCLSVIPFWLCSHHCISTQFSGIITKDRGNAHAKGQGQRLKFKVTEVNTQLSRFRPGEMNTYISQIQLDIKYDIYAMVMHERWSLIPATYHALLEIVCPKIASVTLRSRLVRVTTCHPFGTGRRSNQQWFSIIWHYHEILLRSQFKRLCVSQLNGL